MKKLLILLLLLVSTSVFAEWTAVDRNAAGITTYADFGTIKRKGNKVKMWSLLDYKTVQKGVGDYRYLSVMTRDEYDCEEETILLLDFYRYSGNMREGDIVYSAPNIKVEARSVAPESIDEALFKIACGKK